MLNKRIFLVVAVVLALAPVVGLSATALILPPQQNNGPTGPLFEIAIPPWLTSPSNEISISQLAAAYAAHNLTLELPSQLPGGLSLTSVHVPNVDSPYGYAMVTYSSKGVTDFRYAEVVFEIKPGAQPSATELNAIANNMRGSFQLLTVAGIPVLLNPQAQMGYPDLQKQFGSVPYAQFWKGGIYYQVRAYQPLTADDLLTMIANLQPVR